MVVHLCARSHCSFLLLAGGCRSSKASSHPRVVQCVVDFVWHKCFYRCLLSIRCASSQLESGSQNSSILSLNASTTTKMADNNTIDEDQLTRTFNDIFKCLDDSDGDNEPSFSHRPPTSSIDHTPSSSSDSILSSVRLSNHGKTSFDLADAHSANAAFNAQLLVEQRQRRKSCIGSGKASGSSMLSTPLRSLFDDPWGLRKPSSVWSTVAKASTAVPFYATPIKAPRMVLYPQSPFYEQSPAPRPPIGLLHPPPPGDYVCRLCNVPGHWLKDCCLYQPRPGNHHRSSSTSAMPVAFASIQHRSAFPPGNYVCRLCNIPGHWIEQCELFEPHVGSSNGFTSPTHGTAAANVGRARFGGGAFSSPPPASYVCKLCNEPGHWIQQCIQFVPIALPPHSRRV